MVSIKLNIKFLSERTKQVANVILLFLMICAVCLHWAIEDKLERTAPAIVFFFMLSCRLVVEWQLHRQEKAEALAKVQAAKVATSETRAKATKRE